MFSSFIKVAHNGFSHVQSLATSVSEMLKLEEDGKSTYSSKTNSKETTPSSKASDNVRNQNIDMKSSLEIKKDVDNNNDNNGNNKEEGNNDDKIDKNKDENDTVTDIVTAFMKELSNKNLSSATLFSPDELNNLLEVPNNSIDSPFSEYPLEWIKYVEGLINDENTYIIPAQRIVESSMDKLTKLSVKEVAKRALDALYSPDNKQTVTECILELSKNETITDFHHRIMPRYVSEEKFWKNLIWRLLVSRNCTSVDQLIDVLEVLNTETDKIVKNERERVREIGVDNTEGLGQVRRTLLEYKERKLWVAEKAKLAEETIKNSISSRQLFENLLAKDDLSDLTESVCESCKYYKTKIAMIIGALEENNRFLEYTKLDLHGELHRELIKANETLNGLIGRYIKRKSSKDSEEANLMAPTKEIEHWDENLEGINDNNISEAIANRQLPLETFDEHLLHSSHREDICLENVLYANENVPLVLVDSNSSASPVKTIEANEIQASPSAIEKKSSSLSGNDVFKPKLPWDDEE